MSKPSQASIRGTLTFTLLMGAGFLVLGVSFLLDVTIIGFLNERFDADMFNRAQSLITLTKVFEEGIDLDYAGEFMPEFETAEGPEFFEIWLPDGSLLERSESLEERMLPQNHEPTMEPVWQDFELEDAGRCRLLRIAFLPQHEDADVEGELSAHQNPDQAVTLLLARKRGDFDQLVRTIHLLIWGSLGVLLMMVVLFVRLALRRGLRPLDDIQNQVQSIDPSALETRIHLRKPVVELTAIVNQLNAMLARLEAGANRERRFTSDVAHELRTPLSELRSLSEVGDLDPDDREMVVAFFQDTREIALEMEQLVATLLELSRCDSGTRMVNLEDINLLPIVQKAWKRIENNAAQRGIRLDNQLTQPFVVRCDELMVEQIIQNLINNAVFHGPQDSTVVVALHEKGSGVCIRNPAPNLEPGDLEHLFDRFWQKDAARTGGKNSGLGLSLASAFADISGIDLSAELDRGHICFSLVFS